MRQPRPSRRGVLRAAGAAGIAALGGCVFASSTPDPGALELVNRGSDPRTVTVSATRTSDDPGDVRRSDRTPAPGTTSDWTHETSFAVDGDADHVEPDFFPGPGAYYVVARLPDGSRDADWIRVGEAVDGGSSSGYAHVTVSESGELEVRGWVR